MRSDLITPQEGIDTASSQFVSAASLRVRLDWFNRLRWLAGLGVLGATTLTAGVMRLPLPAAELSILGAGLLLLNVGYVWRNHRLHHYKNEHYWFAVVTAGTADRVLGTYPEPSSVASSPTVKALHTAGRD